METVKYRSRGNDVLKLQEILRDKGYIIGVDGIFGTGTKAAVMQFQKNNYLIADGIVGAKTWAVLHSASSKVGFHILKKNTYTTIVKIPIESIKKIDIVNSVGAFETVKSMQKRTGAKIMINGILYGMINGREIVKFIDEKTLIAPGIFSDFCLMIYDGGNFDFDTFKPSPMIRDCIGAAPSLVRNGIKYIDTKGFEKDKGFIVNRHPRVAIGRDANSFYIILVDGRRLFKPGMNINELAQLCLDVGCDDAFNVDGGDSIIGLVDLVPINDPRANRAVANGLGIWIEEQG